MQVLYLGRAPRTKETLPDFHEKFLVTRHSRVFRELTGSHGRWARVARRQALGRKWARGARRHGAGARKASMRQARGRRRAPSAQASAVGSRCAQAGAAGARQARSAGARGALARQQAHGRGAQALGVRPGLAGWPRLCAQCTQPIFGPV